ncbi:MFS transporter [Nocardia ninae]|uniref:Chloramphenicol resistance protein n=1 Tax=Nocardia ninae NBRC 108245 TaxID=1210091 RepID=A0A511M7V6_9NOCA|nr:MFS transporter [Nocardia ninae]GEM35786.1 chloramphenicol resistance protein [Nocardia ninae NBRC 108245]
MSVNVSDAHNTAKTRFLPVSVYLLAFGLFAMGSAEFLLAGVLPAVAADIDVSMAAVGGLITSFAIGVVVGGPPFAILSLRWPRRIALVVTQVGFAACIAIGLIIGTYSALLITRFAAGLAYAGFFAVAASTAVGLVPADRAARASGVVVSGLGLAMILGGPAGTLIGYRIGWQGGFWLVIALTLGAAIAVGLTMPPTSAAKNIAIGTEFATLRNTRLWLVYAITLLSTAAYMVTFNYLAELLITVTGLGEIWVAPVLVVFGVGSYIGLAVGGRISDRLPHRAMLIGAAGIAAGSILLAVGAESVLVVIPLVLLLGVAGFVLNPAIYGRVFALAADAPTLAGATTVSAFQLGISLVPLLAGSALGAGASITAIPWIGAGLALLSVPLVVLENRSSRIDAASSHPHQSTELPAR